MENIREWGKNRHKLTASKLIVIILVLIAALAIILTSTPLLKNATVQQTPKAMLLTDVSKSLTLNSYVANYTLVSDPNN